MKTAFRDFGAVDQMVLQSFFIVHLPSGISAERRAAPFQYRIRAVQSIFPLLSLQAVVAPASVPDVRRKPVPFSSVRICPLAGGVSSLLLDLPVSLRIGAEPAPSFRAHFTILLVLDTSIS